MQSSSYLIPGTFQQMVVEPIESPARFGADDDTRAPAGARLALTGNPLDIAIQGDGYFQVMLPSGAAAFTRYGRFRVDDRGRLVTEDGNPVMPAIAPPVGSDSLVVSCDGLVTAFFSALMIAMPSGQFQLAKFFNPGTLIHIGNGLYQQSGTTGAPHISPPDNREAGTGKLLQYFLEPCNADKVKSSRKADIRQRLDHKTTSSLPRLLQSEFRIGT